MSAICRADYCGKPRTSRSLYCSRHATRHRRYGDPNGRRISPQEMTEARAKMRAFMVKYAHTKAMTAALKIMDEILNQSHQLKFVTIGHFCRRSVGWGYLSRSVLNGLTADEALEIVGAVYLLGWERETVFPRDHRLNVHIGFELQRSKGLPCRESYVKGQKKNRYPSVTARQKREVGDAVREQLGRFLANVVLTLEDDRKAAEELPRALVEPMSAIEATEKGS